jgi:NAD(P)-dependent dehydrogenase (short-subunit alcohol dehydrogenase family)
MRLHPKRMLGAHRYHAGMLAGRVVLVTGGDRGIGQAIALGLEDAHATVAVVDGDFASLADSEAAVGRVRESAGPLDAVVHAFVDPAALTMQPLADTTDADWDRRCEAMLRAALYCCQAAGRELSARGGRLVLVTPTIALTGAAGLVPYATAVEGMRAMAKSAARQWGGSGITVNCVAPPVELMAPAGTPNPAGLALAGRALGREPDARRDVAPVVALLAADAAHLVTGATIPVDGGSVMAP